jgi:HPt (histidine-containing phosphotransfer) domain-containing protein
MPVICITAVAINTEWQKFKESGMDAYLPKPFTEENLMATILSVIRGDGSSEDYEPGREETLTAAGQEMVNLQNLYHIAGGDDHFIKQMLTTFMDSTKKGLNELDRALASGNLEYVADLAHKMLPPCRHIGAKSLYSNLKLIEDNVKKNGEIRELQSLARESMTYFESLTAILNAEIEKIN